MLHVWLHGGAHARCRLNATVVRAKKAAAGSNDDDDDDDEVAAPGRPLRVERLLANLGYGKRRECGQLVKAGAVTTREGGRLKVGEKVAWADVLLEGEPLDPPAPLALLLHKPTGYVVTSPDDEKVTDPVIYDLLPYRYGRRRPFLAPVGRLDKDTSGLLLLTDDGTMLHRINSPKRGIWKVYEAKLAEPLTPKQAEAAARRFASGTLVLEGDHTPLLPARLDVGGDGSTARVAICEGRYHQVRRMFAAVGNRVVALHRTSVGGLTLGSLPESEWRALGPEELAAVFEGPTQEEVLAGRGIAGGAAAAAIAGGSSGGVAASDSQGSVTGGSAVKEEAADGGSSRVGRVGKGKARKAARAAQAAAALGESDEEDEEGFGVEEESGSDVELLAYEEEGMGGEEGASSSGRSEGRRAQAAGRGGGARRRRVLAVRQGAVLGGAAEDEEVSGPAGEVEVGEQGEGPTGGGEARRYREGMRRRRQRDALRQMLPGAP